MYEICENVNKNDENISVAQIKKLTDKGKCVKQLNNKMNRISSVKHTQ